MHGDAQRQIVGLRAGAGEHDVFDRRAERRNDLGGKFEDTVLHVARMGTERLHLTMDRFDDARVAVADRYDVVVSVEVFVALRIPHLRTEAAADLDGLGVHQPVGWSQQLAALADLVLKCGVKTVHVVGVEAVDHPDIDLGLGGRIHDRASFQMLSRRMLWGAPANVSLMWSRDRSRK